MAAVAVAILRGWTDVITMSTTGKKKKKLAKKRRESSPNKDRLPKVVHLCWNGTSLVDVLSPGTDQKGKLRKN